MKCLSVIFSLYVTNKRHFFSRWFSFSAQYKLNDYMARWSSFWLILVRSQFCHKDRLRRNGYRQAKTEDSHEKPAQADVSFSLNVVMLFYFELPTLQASFNPLNLVPRVFVLLDQRSENERPWEQPFWNNKGNNRILPIWFHCAVCIYGACLKWLLPENSRFQGAGQGNEDFGHEIVIHRYQLCFLLTSSCHSLRVQIEKAIGVI